MEMVAFLALVPVRFNAQIPQILSPAIRSHFQLKNQMKFERGSQWFYEDPRIRPLSKPRFSETFTSHFQLFP